MPPLRGRNAAAAPAVNPSADRAAAYKQLLDAAAARGDAGASSQMMADTLNGVDMGGAYRARHRWDMHDLAMTNAGRTELEALQAAYAAQRAKLGGRRSAGGGGGGGERAPAPQPDPFWAWYNAQYNKPTPTSPGAAGGWGT
jgi:hypothetical protein